MKLRRGQIANKNLANKNLKVVPNILSAQNSAHRERIASAAIFFVYPHPQSYHHPHHRHCRLGAYRQRPILLLRGWKLKGKLKHHGVGPLTGPLSSDSNNLPSPPPLLLTKSQNQGCIFFFGGGLIYKIREPRKTFNCNLPPPAFYDFRRTVDNFVSPKVQKQVLVFANLRTLENFNCNPGGVLIATLVFLSPWGRWSLRKVMPDLLRTPDDA